MRDEICDDIDEDLDLIATCVRCDCTEFDPCFGGCYWVDDGGMEDVCSNCVEVIDECE